MKKCPECGKMNSAYATSCKYCGCEIKWAPDDGVNYGPLPNFSDEGTKFQDSGNIDDERDIYNQLEDIKNQMNKGVNLFDVTMPFDKMVFFMIKLALASIPAVVIMGFISIILSLFFGNMLSRAILKSYGIH